MIDEKKKKIKEEASPHFVLEIQDSTIGIDSDLEKEQSDG